MELSDLFSSSSKYRILRTLCNRETPTHLRALAELSNVQIRSAQIAVESLLKTNVITKHKKANRVMLSLNKQSKFSSILIDHFKVEKQQEIASRATKHKDLESILQKVNQLRVITWRKEIKR